VMGTWIEEGREYEAKFRCKFCKKVFEYYHHVMIHIEAEHFNEIVDVLKIKEKSGKEADER